MSVGFFLSLLFLSFAGEASNLQTQYAENKLSLKKTTRYYCASHLRSGERASQYFDRLFVIEKSDEQKNTTTANFPLHTEPSFEMRQKSNILYGYFQIFAGKRRANEDYREEYDIYRLNIEDGALIKSHVKYTSKKYYEWFKADTEGNPYSAPLSSEPLKYIDKVLPKGLIKFGWDGSFYHCKKISYPKYFLHSIGMALFQILGA